MQLYRGMDIGTAKLPVGERRGIPHHLFDVLDVTDEAAVAWYQDAARAAIDDIHARGADAILVGGSGLYVSSVHLRLPLPAARRRAPRASSRPNSSATVPACCSRGCATPTLPRRRASTRRTAGGSCARSRCSRRARRRTARLPDEPVLWREDTRIIGVAVPRDELVGRLDARVERMWARGCSTRSAALRARGSSGA